MIAKYLITLFSLLNCIGLNAQNKLKTITELEYKISKADNNSSKKDTICGMLGCFNVKKYNQNGQQTNLISYDNKKEIVFKSNLIYHKNGNLDGVKTYNSKNEISFEDKYIYKDNKLARLENYRATDILNFYQIYVYKKDNLVQIDKYQVDNKIISSEFIEKGKTKKIIEFGYNGFSTTVYKFEYNKAGLIERKQKFRIKEDKSEELLETENFIYDNKNNLLEASVISNFYPSESHKYEYDVYGNWIKRINLYDGKETITERTIEYY